MVVRFFVPRQKVEVRFVLWFGGVGERLEVEVGVEVAPSAVFAEGEIGIFGEVAGGDDEVEQVLGVAPCRFFQADDDAFYLYARRRNAQFLVKPAVCKEWEAVFFEDFAALWQANAGKGVNGYGVGHGFIWGRYTYTSSAQLYVKGFTPPRLFRFPQGRGGSGVARVRRGVRR